MEAPGWHLEAPGNSCFCQLSLPRWRDSVRSGLLLGVQRAGPAGWRHQDQSVCPGAGGGWARVSSDKRGRVPRLCAHERGCRFLLGRKRVRQTRRRDHDQPAHPGAGQVGQPPLPAGRRRVDPHLCPRDRCAGLLLGRQLLRPAGRRNHDGPEYSRRHSRWTEPPTDHGRRATQLRGDHQQCRVLLGIQSVRTDRRWYRPGESSPRELPRLPSAVWNGQLPAVQPCGQ